MGLTEIEGLSVGAADVLRRRARAAAMSETAYVRRELTALADRRVPIDAVVEFLDSERWDRRGAAIDEGAAALIDAYNLPDDVCRVFSRRAAAAGSALGDYIRKELITLARRVTVADAMLEFREIQEQDPSVDIDMDAVLASVRYARNVDSVPTAKHARAFP